MCDEQLVQALGGDKAAAQTPRAGGEVVSDALQCELGLWGCSHPAVQPYGALFLIRTWSLVMEVTSCSHLGSCELVFGRYEVIVKRFVSFPFSVLQVGSC